MIFEKIELEENEQVESIIRKHWIVLLKDVFGTSLVLFSPFLLLLIKKIASGFVSLPDLSAYSEIFLFASALWMLICWMMLAYGWTNYYLDLWVVTNRRIILVDQRGFFRRFVSSFRLERLQDINTEVNGIIATLLDYGTVEAQTAGSSHETFSSNYMPKPQEIKAEIIRFADHLSDSGSTTEKNLEQQGL